jgi:hypothetical protein
VRGSSGGRGDDLALFSSTEDGGLVDVKTFVIACNLDC